MSFFDFKIFSLELPQFVSFFPYLILCLSFGLAVIGAGLKFSTRFFKLTAFIGFGFSALLWSFTLGLETEYLLGIKINTATRIVGMFVSTFALSCFALFGVADKYKQRSEWLALLFLCVLGLTALPAAQNWISFFVFMEVFSIPAYVLITYDLNREKSLKASLKYILLGAFSSCLFLLGLALIYFSTGSLDYIDLAQRPLPLGGTSSLGVLLILSGVFFKMTLVPFHFWAPDVYQGAPLSFATFLAASTKVSVFTATLLALFETNFMFRDDVRGFVVVVSLLSVVVGAFLAFHQTSFRRMMAYSGTVNAGILAPLMVGGMGALYSGIFFLFIYGASLILVMGPFSNILRNRKLDPSTDLDIASFNVKDKEGAAISSLIMCVGLFSLAGIPPMPGFMAKYWVFSDLWGLGAKSVVIAGLLASLMGVAYYIRAAGRLYFK